MAKKKEAKRRAYICIDEARDNVASRTAIAGVVGAALSKLVDFLNPDMIVLGGGLIEAMPALMKNEIGKSIESHASTESARAVKVVAAMPKGHAGTVGAACLAVDMFSGRPPIELEAL